MRTVAQVFAGVLVLLAAAGAHASESRFGLAWVRGPAAGKCPDAEVAAAEVARRLAADPFGPHPAKWLEVTISHDVQTGWQAELRVRNRSGAEIGARTLRSSAEDCGPIFQATVLALALAIDPDALVGPLPVVPARFPDVEPPPRPSPPPASAPVEPAPPCPSLEPPPVPEPPSIEVAGLLLLEAGLLPAPGVGFGVGTAVHWPSSFGFAAGMANFPARETSPAVGMLDVGLSTAWLEGSYAPVRSGAAALSITGGVAAGVLHVAVDSPIPQAPGDSLWVAATLGSRGQLRLAGPLVGEAGVRGFVPVTRYSLEVDGTPAFSAPPVGAVAHLGLGIDFW